MQAAMRKVKIVSEHGQANRKIDIWKEKGATVKHWESYPWFLWPSLVASAPLVSNQMTKAVL